MVIAAVDAVCMAGRGRPKADLVLTDEERETLRRWSARRSSAQALALRCRIVLACGGAGGAPPGGGGGARGRGGGRRSSAGGLALRCRIVLACGDGLSNAEVA